MPYMEGLVLPQFSLVPVKLVTKPQNKPVKPNPWFLVAHSLVLLGTGFKWFELVTLLVVFHIGKATRQLRCRLDKQRLLLSTAAHSTPADYQVVPHAIRQLLSYYFALVRHYCLLG